MADTGANPTIARESGQRMPGVFGSRTFRVLFAAEAQSTMGDQLARVALSILVFERTGSTVGTALTYAATFLPAVLGGYVLAGVGDRYSRRLVMVVCDAARALLFASMAAPGVPLPGIVALLVVAVFIGPTFTASEVSLLAAELGPERFRSATGLRMMTGQLAQVVGFGAGGILVAWLHPRGALLVDAATFALSAIGILLLLPARREPSGVPGRAGGAEDAGEDVPFAGMWRDRRLRGLVLLSTLAGFFVVPEGLAVPFADDIGGHATQTGLLLAAIPLGGAVGAALLLRAVPPVRRSATAGAMAVGCGLPFLVSAANPHWLVAGGAWFLSGMLSAYQVEVVSVLVRAIPDRYRARSMGVVGALLVGSQGAGLAVFGALAQPLGAGRAIALAGLIGSGAALLVGLGLLRRR